MARSDKVAFRREFSITEPGYVGNESVGFFVGDILSLHIDFSRIGTAFILEGKVGRQGTWENIETGSKGSHFPDIDIRSYEYFRLCIIDVTQPVNVIIFGYEENVIQKEITTKYNDRDFMQLCKMTQASEDMREELIKLNKYMEIITGEKL